MTDRQLIELGARELAARHGFNLDSMRQRDFEYLCTRIEESSGILISLSTIKRILNGQYNRLPQVATLNAIAVNLGYANWQAFKTAKQAPIPAPAAKAKNRRLSYPLIAAGIVGLFLISLLSFNYFSAAPSSTPAPNGAAASFGIRRTTANTVPNTVVFTYDIDHIPGDSFFIQQSWDRHRRVRIAKGSHTLTDIYYEPGYHTAKLIANDKIIKTLPVSIPTDGWFFYSKESLSRGLPAYIHTSTPTRNGILGLTSQDLVNNRIDPDKPQVILYTWFPGAIATSADNFRLDARIKMTDLRNTACPFIMPEIFCQHGLLYFAATLPGCTGAGGEINAQFGNHFLDARSTDLSPLAIDIHSWHNIEMLVKQQQVTISIDGKPVLSSSYTTSAGSITGLGFHSNGLAAIDSIHLTGLDGSSVYPR
ncbi:MAG TPA: hypothetical protein VHE34_06150 [Puia sp.]|uniref:hypothetical protein n=1 Tax=Puia sp. TaxID=2045100 RepID=UPI002B535672|nr:hypothetical protein [Puia sp.]HVU94785.1 hypothetical protein [Puia sp.]